MGRGGEKEGEGRGEEERERERRGKEGRRGEGGCCAPLSQIPGSAPGLCTVGRVGKRVTYGMVAKLKTRVGKRKFFSALCAEFCPP